ncbi:TPA: hypothetical protein QCP80_003365 [Bacillus cereus]|uniref:hypothetical protein n=1 Tax=Bacillus anthracis TaxID=1392 RepID=UPI0033098E1F|nr:hypothetical protein [Bacillus cereus]
MLIILEGNELNFKTTIAEKLAERLKYGVVKGNSFLIAQLPAEDLFQYVKGIADHADNLIVDRYYMSNLVYTELYDGYSRLGEEQVKYLEEQLKEKALVVYLHASPETLIKRKQEREEKEIADNMFDTINKGFERIIVGSELDVLSLSTEELTSDYIVDIIIANIRHKEAYQLNK